MSINGRKHVLIDGIAPNNLYSRGLELPTTKSYKCLGSIEDLTERDFKVIIFGDLKVMNPNMLNFCDVNHWRNYFYNEVKKEGYTFEEGVNYERFIFNPENTYLFAHSTDGNVSPLLDKEIVNKILNIKEKDDVVLLIKEKKRAKTPLPIKTSIKCFSQPTPVTIDYTLLESFKRMCQSDKRAFEEVIKRNLISFQTTPDFLDYFGYEVRVYEDGRSKIFTILDKDLLVQKIKNFIQ